MRRIGLVTVARSDYGIYLPVLKELARRPGMEFGLFVGGMHLSPAHGRTLDQIQADGWPITAEVEMTPASDSPGAVAESLGQGVKGFSKALEENRPDVLVVLGDRFEMFAAAAAALPHNIPVAHIHGGEVTRGAMDESLRHGMTKLSHLHMASTEGHARRIVQMGEEPWRVRACGAPGLDNLAGLEPMSPRELAEIVGFVPDRRALLATFHPVTLEHQDTARHVEELAAALDRLPNPLIITMPNADAANRLVSGRLRELAAQRGRTVIADNLGARAYFSLMACVGAMVGNSSSGIIEAPSLGLPVVNIGTRQQGRTRAGNVIDVGYGRDEIAAGLDRALSAEFRRGLEGMKNPYGDGRAAPRIVRFLAQAELGPGLLMKRFHDLPGSASSQAGPS